MQEEFLKASICTYGGVTVDTHNHFFLLNHPEWQAAHKSVLRQLPCKSVSIVYCVHES